VEKTMAELLNSRIEKYVEKILDESDRDQGEISDQQAWRFFSASMKACSELCHTRVELVEYMLGIMQKLENQGKFEQGFSERFSHLFDSEIGMGEILLGDLERRKKSRE
jgi:hypothetical protein